MKHKLLVCLVVMTASAVAVPAPSAQTCDGEYFLLEADSTPRVLGGRNDVTLPSEIVPPSAMATTTLADWSDWGFNFITHADKVHVVHYATAASGPELTFNIKSAVGLSGTLILMDVSAAGGATLDDDTQQHVLYVVGYLADGMNPPEPYYFVLDQQIMLNYYLNPGYSEPYVLASGKLCTGGQTCAGVAGEVQAFTRTGNAEQQQAYVNVLTFTMPLKQQIFRLVRGDGANGPWNKQVAYDDLDPSNTDFPNLGFSMDRNGSAYSVFGEQIINVDDDSVTCKFGDIVTDLAIWGVNDWNNNYKYRSYTFATVQTINPAGSRLVVFPTGTCPNFSLTSSLSVPVGHPAIKTMIYQKSNDWFDVFALAENGTVKKMTFSIEAGGGPNHIGGALPDPFPEDIITLESQSTVNHGATVADITPMPINLCGQCNTTMVDGVESCFAPCWINESGDRDCMAYYDSGNSPAQPPRCAEPDDPLCPGGTVPKPNP